MPNTNNNRPHHTGRPHDQNRERDGRFAPCLRPEPDFELTSPASNGDGELDDDWDEVLDLPSALERLIREAPGWTSLVTRFASTCRSIAPSFEIAAFRSGRELKVLWAVSVNGEDDL